MTYRPWTGKPGSQTGAANFSAAGKARLRRTSRAVPTRTIQRRPNVRRPVAHVRASRTAINAPGFYARHRRESDLREQARLRCARRTPDRERIGTGKFHAVVPIGRCVASVLGDDPNWRIAKFAGVFAPRRAGTKQRRRLAVVLCHRSLKAWGGDHEFSDLSSRRSGSGIAICTALGARARVAARRAASRATGGDAGATARI